MTVIAGEAQPAKPAADPAKLIELLENGDFDERHNAFKQLQSLGEAARPVLEKALKNQDSPELKDQIERLLVNLQQSRLYVEVFDTAGNPVPNLEFSLNINTPEGGETQNHPLKTDAQGRAQLSDLQPGPIYLSSVINTPGYQVSTHEFSPYMLQLGAGENFTRYVVCKGGAVKGRVQTEDGKPVQNATVSLQPDYGQPWDLENGSPFAQQGQVATGQSDADGNFCIENANYGAFYPIATHDDFTTQIGESVFVREGQTINLASPIKMPAKKATCGSIKLQLLDNEAKPVSEANVRAVLSREDEVLPKHQQAAMVFGKPPAPGVSVSSDKEGNIELKDLAPGKWNIVIYPDSDVVYVAQHINVSAGNTASGGALKPQNCGKIEGKVVSANGKGLQFLNLYCFMWEDPSQLKALKEAMQTGNASFEADLGENSVSSQENGAFTFEKLAPGTYSICALNDVGIIGFHHGIKVKPGETTKSGPLPTNLKLDDDFKIAGKVVLPNAMPAADAQVNLVYSNGSTNIQTDADGGFDFTEFAQNGVPQKLTVTLPGYRTAVVDLSAERPEHKIVIKLEKQAYGSLDVIVTDPDGSPLSKARVVPVQRNTNSEVNAVARTTDSTGRVLLKGLVAEKRQFNVKRIGYYLEKPVEVTIKPDVVNKLEVKLQRGAILNGRLSTQSKAADLSKALVYLMPLGPFQENENGYEYCQRSCKVDAQERFHFGGLKPGKYRLSVSLCGFTIARDSIIDIKPNENNVDAALVAAAGVRISGGSALRASSISFAPAGDWKKQFDHNAGTQVSWSYGTIDSKGNSETYGLSPGKYDIIITRTWQEDQQQPIQNELAVSATLVCPDIQIESLNGGFAKIESLKPLPVTLPIETGTVSGRVTLKEKHDFTCDERGIAQLDVSLIGERAYGSVALSLPEQLDAHSGPAVKGTPPADIKFQPPGQFLIKDIPAGDYKLKVSWTYYDQPGNKSHETEVLTKSITVKAKETVNLGEIKAELSVDLLNKMREEFRRRTLSIDGELTPDENPVFRP